MPGRGITASQPLGGIVADVLLPGDGSSGNIVMVTEGPAVARESSQAAPAASAGEAAGKCTMLLPGQGRCTDQELQTVPPGFCKSSFDRPCMTNFEAKYVLWHGTEGLTDALNILRAPGCFPNGKFYSILGLYRTGSTLLYNIVRLWSAMASREGTVGGFGCQWRKSVAEEPFRANSSCTLVCKDHELRGDGTEKNTDVMLMSHRDPAGSICSRKVMGQWCTESPKGLSDEDRRKWWGDCRKGMFEEAEVKIQCKTLMQAQTDVYRMRYAAGKDIAIDVGMSSYFEQPEQTVASIGRAMGICEEALASPPLFAMVLAMMKQIKSKPDEDMGITMMHDSSQEMRKICVNLTDYMRADEACREWMDGGGAPEANRILRNVLPDLKAVPKG